MVANNSERVRVKHEWCSKSVNQLVWNMNTKNVVLYYFKESVILHWPDLSNRWDCFPILCVCVRARARARVCVWCLPLVVFCRHVPKDWFQLHQITWLIFVYMCAVSVCRKYISYCSTRRWSEARKCPWHYLIQYICNVALSTTLSEYLWWQTLLFEYNVFSCHYCTRSQYVTHWL